MKAFKGIGFASTEFGLIPVLEKSADLIKNLFCLSNDWNVFISKAEKVQICGKTFITLPSYMVRNAYCLIARKQLSDMSVLY